MTKIAKSAFTASMTSSRLTISNPRFDASKVILVRLTKSLCAPRDRNNAELAVSGYISRRRLANFSFQSAAGSPKASRGQVASDRVHRHLHPLVLLSFCD
jgi:hypothetical protein